MCRALCCLRSITLLLSCEVVFACLGNWLVPETFETLQSFVFHNNNASIFRSFLFNNPRKRCKFTRPPLHYKSRAAQVFGMLCHQTQSIRRIIDPVLQVTLPETEIKRHVGLTCRVDHGCHVASQEIKAAGIFLESWNLRSVSPSDDALAENSTSPWNLCAYSRRYYISIWSFDIKEFIEFFIQFCDVAAGCWSNAELVFNPQGLCRLVFE